MANAMEAILQYVEGKRRMNSAIVMCMTLFLRPPLDCGGNYGLAIRIHRGLLSYRADEIAY